MSVLRQLYQLQHLDSEWDQTSARLEAVHAELAGTGEVERAQQAVDESQARLADLRKNLRALELEIGGLTSRLKTNQERLYGGKVRNPKELSSLQDEAASLQRRMSDLEDDQLELMIEIDQDEAELAERHARLRQIDTTWRRVQVALQREKDQLRLRQSELEQDREQLRAGIGPAYLARYDFLRPRTGGRPIALLKNGICQACGVDVPTGVAREVERGSGEYDCPICSRLLYGGG